MAIVSDYTRAGNPNTFVGGAFQAYRIVHWLKDILRNFFSSSINLKDERLCGLLRLQDGQLPTELDAMFRVGVPFNPKSVIKAGITPAVIVSAGETSYPSPTFNVIGAQEPGYPGCLPAYSGMKHMLLKLQVSTITETYDGTLLMSNLIEAFLATHNKELKADNAMVSQFNVLGSSGPQEVPVDQAGMAKTVYQASISLSVVGGVSWTTYAQQPPFRGVELKVRTV